MVRKAACMLVLCLTGFLSIQSSSMALGQAVAPGRCCWMGRPLKDGTWSATPTGRWLTVRCRRTGHRLPRDAGLVS